LNGKEAILLLVVYYYWIDSSAIISSSRSSSSKAVLHRSLFVENTAAAVLDLAADFVDVAVVVVRVADYYVHLVRIDPNTNNYSWLLAALL